MNVLDQIRLKLFIRLHNYLYIKIGALAIKINNGIHPKHKIMNYHQFFVDNIDKDSTILDIGCGIGALSYDLAKKAKKIVAIDIVKNNIEIANRKYFKDNIQYIVGDATKYDFKGYFDFVVLSNVLEHIQNRIEFLNRIKTLAKYFLFRVPMINRSWLPLYKKELGLEYRLDKTHFIEYTFETFQEEINKAGMKIVFYSIQFGEIWAKINSR